jgi:uncharacterized protein (DUF305 family)
MTRTTMVRRALLAGAASAILLVAAGCGTAGLNHDGMTPTGTAPPGASTAAFNDADVMFAQMMIPHHQQAVEMATLAETRVQDPELKQLAATIKAAQQPEITTMTGWLTAWGKPTLGPGDLVGAGHGGHGGMSGMMSAEEMTQLAAANELDFDRMFARMMIAHHNGALQMAQELETTGTNPDAIALARAILKSQAAEVVTLQKISDRL